MKKEDILIAAVIIISALLIYTIERL